MRVRMSERKERGGKDGKTLTEVELCVCTAYLSSGRR